MEIMVERSSEYHYPIPPSRSLHCVKTEPQVKVEMVSPQCNHAVLIFEGFRVAPRNRGVQIGCLVKKEPTSVSHRGADVWLRVGMKEEVSSAIARAPNASSTTLVAVAVAASRHTTSSLQRTRRPERQCGGSGATRRTGRRSPCMMRRRLGSSRSPGPKTDR